MLVAGLSLDKWPWGKALTYSQLGNQGISLQGQTRYGLQGKLRSCSEAKESSRKPMKPASLCKGSSFLAVLSISIKKKKKNQNRSQKANSIRFSSMIYILLINKVIISNSAILKYLPVSFYQTANPNEDQHPLIRSDQFLLNATAFRSYPAAQSLGLSTTEAFRRADFILATDKALQVFIFIIDFILLFCFRHLGEGTGEQQRVGRVAERGRINQIDM